ncbi:MAG: HlyD family efflux transporter periplasmic adaptor subunit [Chloroflexi bacterium]|nr:HlyD family efflux transporter periplasmic adaptor subunit [Chloroflexota bacterium]
MLFLSLKWSRVRPVVLAVALAGVSLFVLSCTPRSNITPQNQVVVIQRGDLSIDITATGNLAFSEKEGLSFEMAGKVAEVLVEEGDSIEEGQVLARMDTSADSDWQKQLDALYDQIAVAKDKITTAERQVIARERDLLQAQINLQTAQDNLENTPPVQEATDNVTRSEYDLKLARALLDDVKLFMDQSSPQYNTSIQWRQSQVDDAQTKLNEARKILADVQAANRSSTSTDIEIKRLQVELTQGKVEDAQQAIEDAKQSVEDAKDALEEAQNAWEEAKAYKTELAAPFAGVITRVNASSGDQVTKGAVLVEVADDTRFEADVLVSETDIYQLKTGGQASVQIDAMSSASLPARVSRISPTATIQQGVVNYRVKVEMQPVAGMLSGQPGLTGNVSTPFGRQGNLFGRFGDSGNITPGQLPEQAQEALRERGLTQEQIQEMMRNRMAGLPGAGGTGQMPAMGVAQQVQLREGMTVTVTITVEQKTNVLLVPNRAITRQGGQNLVNMQKADGTVESRPIQIGINDFQYTEVLEGLSEGEQVIVTQSTSTNSNSRTQGGQQRFMVPGGGMLR